LRNGGINRIEITNISNRDRELLSGRRAFLKGMVGAGAFVLSVRLMPESVSLTVEIA